MCGRYILTASGEELASLFGLDSVSSILARYNIAPGQSAPLVIRPLEGRRTLVEGRWGLAAGDGRSRFAINARSETAATRRAFRGALARRRCLVPASGFFEWAPSESGGERRPHLFRRPDEKPFAIAGLFEEASSTRPAATPAPNPSRQLALFASEPVTPSSSPTSGFVLLTTRACGSVESIHARMPVIIDASNFDEWLDPKSAGERLLDRLRDASPGELVVALVSSRVGDVRNDDPDCIRPVDRLAPGRTGQKGRFGLE